MFEHDFGSSDEPSPIDVQEIEHQATEDGLTAVEVIELVQQELTAEDLGPEAEAYEHEVAELDAKGPGMAHSEEGAEKLREDFVKFYTEHESPDDD